MMGGGSENVFRLVSGPVRQCKIKFRYFGSQYRSMNPLQNPPPKRGAPEGERNGRYRHGRYSRAHRERLAAERKRRQTETRVTQMPNPPLDYSKIIADLDAIRTALYGPTRGKRA